MQGLYGYGKVLENGSGNAAANLLFVKFFKYIAQFFMNFL
jgi:hypothetical protein